ncbi:hypothetical protein [methane-oxidizing endosymbiont of Gigantopelta aegis]|uniref:hypothetical protein n=1 Tax=methane-oxidizing endosymbiont of Gigantopelta aegis TaxID=2794938 RepID=UPI0018DCB20E|nr:hypothetical protein [methane-oxidizing endosymbiont of Gigantopelta aegis]
MTEKVVQRLKTEEKLPLARLSKSTPQTLDAAIAENEVGYTTLDLSLPSSSFLTTPLKPPETNRQLSIAEARAMALSNNLDLKIALIEPSIAATYVGEEQAKFDDLIFANVKYSNKDTPKLDGDVVSFTSVNANSPLNNDVAKLNILAQSTEQLDFESGVVIPLRTGGKVTISTPFNSKLTDRHVPSEQYLAGMRFSIRGCCHFT